MTVTPDLRKSRKKEVFVTRQSPQQELICRKKSSYIKTLENFSLLTFYMINPARTRDIEGHDDVLKQIQKIWRFKQQEKKNYTCFNKIFTDSK